MELHELTDWLWCLHTPTVQAYAVRNGDGVNLIDTSTAGEEDAILAALGERLGVAPGGVRVEEIFLTHGHNDHTGSAAALARRTGARVLGPALEAPIIDGRRPRAEPVLHEWEKPIFEQVMPTVPEAPPVTLDVELVAGAALDWDRPAVLVAAPGHTAGQLAVWFPAERILVAADAIASHEGRPMTGVFNVDPLTAMRTFGTLAELHPEIACFGHGDALLDDAGARLREVAAELAALGEEAP